MMQEDEHGLFFEDFVVGRQYITGSRTIGLADVEGFSSLTLDQNPIHSSTGFMANHPLQQPVVHGMLLASIAVGLVSELRLTATTLVAMLEQRMQFKRPVYVGDTIHVKMEVIEKRETGNPMRGIVIYTFDVVGATGVVSAVGTNTIMVFRKDTVDKNGDEQ